MSNYEKKIEEMRKELNKAECVASIIERLVEQMQWDCMNRIEDESEKGYHFEDPNEDDYYYDRFVAYKDVITVLEKHYFK